MNRKTFLRDCLFALAAVLLPAKHITRTPRGWRWGKQAYTPKPPQWVVVGFIISGEQDAVFVGPNTQLMRNGRNITPPCGRYTLAQMNAWCRSRGAPDFPISYGQWANA